MRLLPCVLAAVAACEVAPVRRASLDGPTRIVWPATERWSEEMEDEYGEFVARFGAAVEARRCLRFDDCLADPEANSTYHPAIDGNLTLEADCADLPYLLRAYFAFKKRLPFGFVSAITGDGGDIRYALAVRPVEWKSWRDFPTPRAALREITRAVHSGTYRTAAEIETGDLYPVRVDRRAVRPGSIFYDPLGHVSVVARVRDDGDVYFVAGTPEGTLTWKRFGSGYVVGRPELGGGFKRWRPLSLERGRLQRAPNAALPDFDGEAQYDLERRVVDGARVGYTEWVRDELAIAATEDPVGDFREQIRALCRDVVERVESVELAAGARLPARPHPAALPENIYGTLGDWETYATPARDARLKAAFRELHETTRALDTLPGLAAPLRAAWAEETAAPACRFAYVSSRGTRVTFGLDTVLDRLFDLSFDPYHCVELRWGAPRGSAELASCPLTAEALAWYDAESRLRNRIDRDHGVPTPLDDGPEEPPDVDVRRVLAEAAHAAAEAGL
jgi:hypothetical protein